MPVRKASDQTAELMKAIRLLTRTKLLVGIPDDSTRPDGTSNAVIGYVMEHGAPEKNIPARPHLVPAIEKLKPKVTSRMKEAGLAALKRDAGGVERAYEALGLEAQSAVRNEIANGSFAPLSEKTLAARRRRGRTGTKPLLDTAQLQRSYTYAVTKA